MFLAIFMIFFPSERTQNKMRTSLSCLWWYGGTSLICGCENKTLHHFFYHKEKHTEIHTEAICHLGVGGPGGVRCVSSGSEKRIQFLVLQKKKKKCVHICMDVHVGWPIHACLCLRPYIYWSFASVIVCINLQHVRFIDRRRKRRPSVTHSSSSSSSKRSTHSRGNVIHRLLGGFLSNALG